MLKASLININLFIIRKRHHKVLFIVKQQNKNNFATRGHNKCALKSHFFLYNIVPNRIDMLANKNSAHHIHFDKTKHDTFQLFGCAKMRFCTVWRAFSFEDFFNKINKLI